MTLYEQFIDVSVKNGADVENLYHKTNDDGSVDVMFSDQISDDDKSIYLFALSFDDKNDTVDLIISKKIKIDNELEIYKKLNSLNAKYRGISFYAVEDRIAVKGICFPNHDIANVFKFMDTLIKVVRDCFNQFESA